MSHNPESWTPEWAEAARVKWPQPTVADNGSSEPPTGVLSHGNALVVDDDQGNRQYVTKALQEGGFEVTEAADGVEGLARYLEREKGYFNIIVSDWSMPRMTGTKMVRYIRRHNTQQKILMMSSDPETVRCELKDFRITDVGAMFKAFTGEELVREVLNVIEGRQCEFSH